MPTLETINPRPLDNKSTSICPNPSIKGAHDIYRLIDAALCNLLCVIDAATTTNIVLEASSTRAQVGGHLFSSIEEYIKRHGLVTDKVYV